MVKFKDAGNDFKETERVVRWPGYEGEISLTEQLNLPGKVHAAEVWRDARRRQLATIHRPDTYEVTQDGAVRTVKHPVHPVDPEAARSALSTLSRGRHEGPPGPVSVVRAVVPGRVERRS